MSHYEICININLTKVYGQPAGCTLNAANPKNSDAVLYGILPDQAAVDEVMARLYELGIDLVLANVHSERASGFARDLKTYAEPEPASLN